MSDSEETKKAKELGRKLYSAVKNNNEDLVVEILNEPDTNIQSYINVSNRWGGTPLYVASTYGFSKIAKIFLDHGVNKDVTTELGETPLHKAAWNGHEEIVELLLEHGANFKIKDKKGKTPIHVSSTQLITKMLLDKGVDVNTESTRGCTPLHEASYHGFPKIVELLLDKGANKDAQQCYCLTPLNLAVGHAREEVVEILLNRGANVNLASASGSTPLHMSPNQRITEMLIASGADLRAKSTDGGTPLHSALRGSKEDVAKTLVAHGADINIANDVGETPLHIAAARGLFIFEYLLENGAISDARDLLRETPLFKLCYRFTCARNEEIERFLQYCVYKYDMIVKECIASTRDSRLLEIFERYVIKLEALNIRIAEHSEFTRRDEGMTDWSEKCKTEAELTKRRITRNNDVTYHDILTQSLEQIANYMRDENIVEMLESRDYEQMFPIYSKIIMNKFKAAQRKCALSSAFTEALDSLFTDCMYGPLPNDVTLKIASFFEDDDKIYFMNTWGLRY